MVARRMGRYALGCLLVGEAENGVRGAAGLEGTGLLEVLAFEEQLCPDKAIYVA